MLITTIIIAAAIVIALAAGVWLTCADFVNRQDRAAELDRAEAELAAWQQLQAEAQALQERATAPHRSLLKNV